MKTFNYIKQTVSIVVLSFVSLLAVASNKIKTEATSYQGSIIPSVTLNEINIEGFKKAKGQVCAMTLVDGSMIPIVQLSEITVNANHSSEKKIVSIIEPVIKSKLLPTVKVDGKYIASVYLNEVQVVSHTGNAMEQNVNYKEVSGKTDDHFANVSVKQSFNRLMNYFVEKTKTAANKILNSLFRK
jgi:hypothetical protein